MTIPLHLQTNHSDEWAAYVERRSIQEEGCANSVPPKDGETKDKPPPIEKTVKIEQASAILIKAIVWLWFGYLAIGKLHILCGRPGCGKTTIGLKLAASVTTGEGWPGGSKSEPGTKLGKVVIWSGEDDPADTLIPRLIQSGAKIDRVYFVRDTTDIDGSREFDPSTDMDALRREIRRIGNVKLLIVDPLVSIVRGDDHKNGVVRRSLQPLADLAAAENVAVLGISHFTKNSVGKDPIDRVTGSLAYGAAARIVLAASKNEDDGVRIFCRAKSNIGADNGGFEYTLKQSPLAENPDITASYVEWGKAVEGEARDILADAEGTASESSGCALSEAEGFLREVLKDGSVEATQIKNEAKELGISSATLRRATKEIGVTSTREGGIAEHGKWFWKLPDDSDRNGLRGSKNPKMLTKNYGHLRPVVSILGMNPTSESDFDEAEI